MSRRLRTIEDWSERAALARWRVSTLARSCCVSVATLERYFHVKMGISPRNWLTKDRMHGARERLRDDSSVKETAQELGYKNAHHFSFAFKKYHGYGPNTYRKKLE